MSFKRRFSFLISDHNEMLEVEVFHSLLLLRDGLEQELVQLTGASDTESGGVAKLVVELFGKQHRKPFLVLFALCALYPLTGMFNIAFFAIDLFEKLGIGNEQAVAVSSALARALGTCFSSLLIHR